jgi:hypothetical protein
MQKLYSVEEEIYTHEELWRSATAVEQRLDDEGADSHDLFLLLPTLLTSIMAYEAFVNFCGFVLLPELWAEEKKNFRGKGIEGKLEAIVQELPHFDWRKEEHPYQDIVCLVAFRNSVAHGKVKSNQYETEQQPYGTHFHFEFKHEWDKYLSINAVKKARQDVKTFCQSLIIAMRKVSDHSHVKYFDAFEGPLASGRRRPNKREASVPSEEGVIYDV